MIAYLGFTTFYPPHSVPVDIFIPVDKKVYHPGDRIGVYVKTCKERTEYKNVSFQLEDVSGKSFTFIGQNNETALKGCFELHDFTPEIPHNIFDNNIIKPGEFRLWIRVDQAQNPFRTPTLYQSEKFTISAN
jgi:hypothetical protein